MSPSNRENNQRLIFFYLGPHACMLTEMQFHDFPQVFQRHLTTAPSSSIVQLNGYSKVVFVLYLRAREEFLLLLCTRNDYYTFSVVRLLCTSTDVFRYSIDFGSKYTIILKTDSKAFLAWLLFTLCPL